jgi:hypothetical protein
MGLFVLIFSVVVLGAHWYVGDSEFRTKLIVTLVWLATWLLLFADFWFAIGAQAMFTLVVGAMTFGAQWVGRR